MSSMMYLRTGSKQNFDADDRAALDTLLMTRGHLAIAREMTAAGYAMSEHTVRRHRKARLRMLVGWPPDGRLCA
jgi:hypothetical protein